MVVYLKQCKVCGKQYKGSTVTKFRATANNYKNTYCSFKKEQKQSNQTHNQKVFIKIISRVNITRFVTGKSQIIYHTETEKSFRQKELYWYHELKTYTPLYLMNVMFTLHIR